MSDLSSPPLSLAPLLPAGAPSAHWHWPTPPFAGYAGAASKYLVACEIEGLTSAAIAAELLAIDFESTTMRVRVNASGTELSLRFAQLRRITLTAPLVAQAPAAGDPHAGRCPNRLVATE